MNDILKIMKILFCGTNVPDKIEYISPEISAAGNRYQNNLIRNLRHLGHEVHNLAYIGVKIERYDENAAVLREESDYDYVYCSRKNIGIRADAHRSYQQKMKAAVAECDVVISYNVFHAWFDLPGIARNMGRRSIVFLADYTPPEGYTDLLHKEYAHIMLDSMKKYDLVVGLSENIRSMCSKRQRFILMEGGIDPAVYDYFEEKVPKVIDGRKVSFMYSGLLSKVTGVDTLLDSMKQQKRKDIRLIVTGKGDLENDVTAAAADDPRIIYMGHLPYDAYMEQLAAADVLINPRNMDLPENKNNFPSKIMDYLASGRRIISTRFAGYERFSGYMEFCGSDAASLASRISAVADSIGNDQEMHIYGVNRNFAQNYLWPVQLERLLEIK